LFLVEKEIPRGPAAVLYIREHLVDVQKTLDGFMKNERKDRFYVAGPPGCGKTCFLYLWARRLSVLENKRVLIIQFREKESNFIWIREAGGTLRRINEAIESSDLRQKVKEIINKTKDEGTPFDLCIHDGVLDNLALCTSMLSTLNTAVTNGHIRKVVHVTSFAFSLSTGGQNLDEQLGTILQASIDSWREEDYQKAVSCEAFMAKIAFMAKTAFMAKMCQTEGSPFAKDKSLLADDAVDGNASNEATAEEHDNDAAEDNEPKNLSDETRLDNATGDTSWAREVVKAKYFFAGGSARFMFQFNIGELRGQLDKVLDAVEHEDWKSFTQGSVSSGSPSAANTLMQQFKGVCTPVSKYVLFRAYEKCKTDLVKSVRAAADASSNPALKGWAFEL
jgi:hypothetical protein